MFRSLRPASPPLSRRHGVQYNACGGVIFSMPKITMRELSEDIVLLSMLTAEPAQPTRNAVVNCTKPNSLLEGKRTISLQRELDIVDNLAFLCATSDDPEKVVALCLEEQVRPDYCTLRISMNTNMPEELVTGLSAIAQVLEKADLQGHGDNPEALLIVAMKMNRNRILSRLRSTHAKTWKKGNRPAILLRLKDMVENCWSTASMNPSRSTLAGLRPVTNELSRTFTLLETSPLKSVTEGEKDGLLLKLLCLLDNLPSPKDLTDVLDAFSLPRDDRFQGRDDLIMTITKLRKYRASCEFLLKAASTITIFRNIAIAKVSIRPCATLVPKGCKPSFTACLDRMGLTWNQEIERRLKSTLPKVSAQFQNEMANLKPKVPAEMQLLFFYEMNAGLQRPRVMRSSKSACFLCNLFIRLHGKFVVARTHGVLYPKWTIPNVHDIGLCKEARQAMTTLVEEFRREIQVEIRKSLDVTGVKRRHPTESLASLQVWLPSDISLTERDPIRSVEYVRTVADAGRSEVSQSEQLNEEDQESRGKHKLDMPDIRREKTEDGLECEATEDGRVTTQQDGQSGPGRVSQISLSGKKSSQTPTMSVNVSNCGGYAFITHHDAGSGAYEREPCTNPSIKELPKNSKGRSPIHLLHGQSLIQDRPPVDLECEKQYVTANGMRDHGSRIHDVLATNDTSEGQQLDDSGVSCARSTNRRFDFHELELFWETEHPVAVETAVISRPEPGTVNINAIVHVNGLSAGEELVMDSYEILGKERAIFLNMQHSGEDR